MENCQLIRILSDCKLQPKDFNSPFKDLKVIVTSAQWGDILFPKKDFSLKKESENFSVENINRFKLEKTACHL
jgi:hypothetical protein